MESVVTQYVVQCFLLW